MTTYKTNFKAIKPPALRTEQPVVGKPSRSKAGQLAGAGNMCCSFPGAFAACVNDSFCPGAREQSHKVKKKPSKEP
ncbi:hypothetical protein NDU88_002987 [Pleurodeles waltl]|uniref:Uncharacterized protein n=1 Tax=Pleurodeles waltl TaxID=8319 RepID=A0AAV7W4D4_PLEWA|nr:hypothetical protein NDU88_002987 [Pleurodeles waltl]